MTSGHRVDPVEIPYCLSYSHVHNSLGNQTGLSISGILPEIAYFIFGILYSCPSYHVTFKSGENSAGNCN